MRTSFKEIKGKDVMTTSGVYLGKVRDIIFEVDTQMIIQYQVSKFPFPKFFGEEKHLIHHKQIANFKEDVIVVKDARFRETSEAEDVEASEPAVMRDDSSSL
ncbi:MAG: PRC-barrel domain-containing protein [Candidatus Magasanikbacteria bacterium]